MIKLSDAAPMTPLKLISLLRRPKSISADRLALCTFIRGKKKIEAKLGIWEDQATQSRADREIEPFADVY